MSEKKLQDLEVSKGVEDDKEIKKAKHKKHEDQEDQAAKEEKKEKNLSEFEKKLRDSFPKTE